MTTCDKTTSVTELPTCTSVPSDSYLIVQGKDSTCKVKVSDLVLGADNLDFYPELTEIKNQLELITSILQGKSANWDGGHSTVQAKSAVWDGITDYNLADIQNTLNAGEPKWDAAHTVVSNNSASWDNTANIVSLTGVDWTWAYNVVYASYQDWDSAYIATRDGISAIQEAMEQIEESPWFELYTGSDPQSVYTTVNTNSAAWNA